MVNLQHYLTRDRIVVIEKGRHDEILDRLIELCLPERDPAQRAEMRRSGQMKDQVLGEGFAITHTRRDDVPDIRVSIGLLGPQVRFCRGETPHTVFCTIIPADKASQYLSFMARLSRFLSLPHVVAAFRSGNAEAIWNCLKEFEA